MAFNSTLNSTGNWVFINPTNVNDILIGYVVVLLVLVLIFCVVNKKCMKEDYKYVEHSGYLDCETHPLYVSNLKGHYRSLDCGIINNTSYNNGYKKCNHNHNQV
jgi:hypothetical protein